VRGGTGKRTRQRQSTWPCQSEAGLILFLRVWSVWLAVAVLREHYDSPLLADWSLRTLREIFGDRMPPLGRVDTRLRRGQEREFFAAVRDWLESGMQRGSCEPLFSVTRALGRRAWLLPELQEMLRRSSDAGNVSGVMRTGITLWLADPRTRAQRAEHVLTADPSAVAIHESGIWAVLCQRRTDLLDRFLTGTPPRGKFLAQGVRWVPLYSPGTGRWLPRPSRSLRVPPGRSTGDG